MGGRLFYASAVIVLLQVVIYVVDGCHFDVPPSSFATTTTTTKATTANQQYKRNIDGDGDNVDDDRLFKQFRLDIIKEKMLRSLGMIRPPVSSRINGDHATVFNGGQNSFMRDLKMLPVGRRFAPNGIHQRRRTGARQFVKRTDGGFPGSRVFGRRTSRVIIFAESSLPTTESIINNRHQQCKELMTNVTDLSRLTFKLPNRSLTSMKHAILWYKTSNTNFVSPLTTTRNETSEQPMTNIWLCPCMESNIISSDNETSATDEGDHLCTHHQDKSKMTKLPKENHQNAGWSQIHLTDFSNLPSVQLALKSNEDGVRVTFLINGNPLSERKRPFLVLEIHDDNSTLVSNRRTKRSTLIDPINRTDCPLPISSDIVGIDKQPRCCRTGFWVDVRQLGWSDWIISPVGFYYHYCSGRCETDFDAIVTNKGASGNRGGGSLLDYSQVMNAYVKRFQLNLKPCCVPRSMSPLPVIITTDHGQTLNRTFIPNFIVNECACLGVA